MLICLCRQQSIVHLFNIIIMKILTSWAELEILNFQIWIFIVFLNYSLSFLLIPCRNTSNISLYKVILFIFLTQKLKKTVNFLLIIKCFKLIICSFSQNFIKQLVLNQMWYICFLIEYFPKHRKVYLCHIYMYIEISQTCLTPPHFCACPKSGASGLC